MAIIHDEEFGKVTVRRSVRARGVRIRVAPDGSLRASLPMYAPVFMVKRLIRHSRDELRKLLVSQQPPLTLKNGMQVGKSHTLIVRPITASTSRVERHGQQIILLLSDDETLETPTVIAKLREAFIAALKIEARSYLPKRLKYLADNHGYSYTKVRFSHASGRWGSCSSNGTISLNIALMKLPFELIDYVLIHELSHTQEMNHSEGFWSLVEKSDPSYRLHRRLLKNETPSV